MTAAQQREFSMQLQFLRSAIYQALSSVLTTLEQSVKRCFQPAKPHLIGDMLADITRSKSELIVENVFLRQQLIVLQRQTKRPVFTPRDRGLLVLLASRFPQWREALMIVKPDTLLGWHRRGFRLFWRYKSKARMPQPRVHEHVIALIHTMALDNRLWGSKRIREELRKLGYGFTTRTVAKYLRQVRPSPPPRAIRASHRADWCRCRRRRRRYNPASAARNYCARDGCCHCHLNTRHPALREAFGLSWV